MGGIPSAGWAICTTLSSNGGDNRAAIQAALDSCGTNRVVKLNSGTFNISDTIYIPSNTVLRGSGGPGSGSSQTRIVMTGGSASIYISPKPSAILDVNRFALAGGFTQITNLATNATKGNTSVQLANALALQVGEIVMIDQLPDPATTPYWGDEDRGPGDQNSRANFYVSNGDGAWGPLLTYSLPVRMRFDNIMGLSSPPPIPGDINLDHIVNSLDWSIMSANWLTSNAQADMNRDGLVNSLDFSILSSNWLRTW